MTTIRSAGNCAQHASAPCRPGSPAFAGRSPAAEIVRQEFREHLAKADAADSAADRTQPAHGELHRRALQAARQAVLAMRDNDEIGDDAFHQIEEELDWLEMAG